MTKGTPSMGKKSGKTTHIKCRRCGRMTYHKTKKVCSSCGFGETSKMRTFKWKNKTKRG